MKETFGKRKKRTYYFNLYFSKYSFSINSFSFLNDSLPLKNFIHVFIACIKFTSIIHQYYHKFTRLGNISEHHSCLHFTLLKQIKRSCCYCFCFSFRFVKAANDRLSFLIRLLGQFSDSERNDFAERFTKDGKIQYYKIYQSVWNSKVASEDNLKQIAALFKGLEKAAMKHIMDITGDGSVAVMSGKLLNLAANLLDGDTWLGVLVNLTQKNTPVINMLSKFLTSEFKGKHTIPTTLNKVLYFTKGFLKATNWMAVIQEYNKDKPNFMKASYEALLQQIKELLVAIGHAKQGDITINDSIQKYIPASLQSVSTAYKNMVKGVAEQVTEINDIKDIIRRAFKTAKEKLKETRERDNNVIVFLVDVLLPGMDSIIGLASNETIYQEAGYDRCTSYMRAYYRKPFGKNVEAFEKDKALQKMIKDYSQSSMCSLWNFMDDVKVMKKDKSFVDAVLDKLMKIVLNALDENVRHANKNVEYVSCPTK